MLKKISQAMPPLTGHSTRQIAVKDNLQVQDKLQFAPTVIIGTKRQSAISLSHRIIKNLKDIFTKLLNRIRNCFGLKKKEPHTKKQVPTVIAAPKQKDINEKTALIEIKPEENRESILPIDGKNEQNVPLNKDVLLEIFSYLEPKDLHHISLANKEFKNLSDEAKVVWINKNKVPISKLGLNFEGTIALLKNKGAKLEYLSATMDQALDFIQYCPDLKLLIIRDENRKIKPEKVAELVASPHISQLKTFVLPGIDLESVEILAASPNFKELEKLDLSNSSIFYKGIKAIVALPNFPKLKKLILRDAKILGLKSLANSPNLPNLQSLDLYNNYIDSDSLRVLASSPNYQKLLSLNLGCNEFDDEDIKILAASKNFLKLQRLDLSFNKIGVEGSKAFGASDNYPNLLDLNLSGNRLGSQGAKAIAESKMLSKLQKLKLYKNNIGNEGISSIANSVNLLNLQVLDLRDNAMGVEGIKDLTSKNWPKLHSLELSHNNIGNEGFNIIAETNNLPMLQKLNLKKCEINSQALRILETLKTIPI